MPLTLFSEYDIWSIGYGPCTTDAATETVSSLVSSATVTVSATFAGTSGNSLAFDMTANGNKAILQAADGIQFPAPNNSGGLCAVSFAAGLSGAPSSAAGVLSGDTGTGGGAQPSGHRYIQVGTDRKLYIYDLSGNQLGPTSTTLVPTSGAMKRVTVSYDNLNHSTTWIKVYFDGVEELSFDSGKAWGSVFGNDYAYFGEWLGSSTNRGCTLYLADFITRYSGTASEAPHITAYPDIKIVGGVTPDADGNFTQWAAVGAASRSAAVNSNDGGTSVITSSVVSQKDTVKSSVANPMAGGSTVIKAQLRQVGDKAGSGKAGYNMMYGTVGTEVEQNVANGYAGTVGTTYAARVCKKLYQDGVSVAPVFADADANASGWGGQTLGSGTVQDNITYAPGPEWIHYTATLPLGTGPYDMKPVIIRQAVNRASTY